MNLPEPWLLASIAVRTAIVVLALLAGVRLFGKRTMGDGNVFDVALVLLLGNAVQNALTYGKGDIGIGLVSVAVLLLINKAWGVLFTSRPWLRTQMFGGPTIVVSNGHIDERAMKREGIDEERIIAAVRTYGLKDLNEVRLAVLEADGTISVVRKEENQ